MRPAAFWQVPKAAQSRRSCWEICKGAAQLRQKSEQSQAESAMAGSIGRSRWPRMITEKMAMQSVIRMASTLPVSEPPHEPSSAEPSSITMTPASATRLAMMVEREVRSPMSRKATPAVTKGTVA